MRTLKRLAKVQNYTIIKYSCILSQVLSEVNCRVGNCTRFLHQGKELAGPENNEITPDNRETHRALILPVTLIFKPTEILFICDGRILKFICNIKFEFELF